MAPLSAVPAALLSVLVLMPVPVHGRICVTLPSVVLFPHRMRQQTRLSSNGLRSVVQILASIVGLRICDEGVIRNLTVGYTDRPTALARMR